MIYRVEVTMAPGNRDSRGEAIARHAAALGITGLDGISVCDLYFLQGDLDPGDVQILVDELLHDPVLEQARWRRLEPGDGGAEGPWFVEVALLPGVTDSVAESLCQGAAMIGISGLVQAASGHRYLLHGTVSGDAAHRIATDLLANEVIQTFHVAEPVAPPFVRLQDQSTPEQTAQAVEVIPLSQADAGALLAISRERRLSLDLAEMQAIQAYYAREGREPKDVELETLAQTWSEHCVHKTFKALITYRETQPDGSVQEQQIDSILNHYIRAATEWADKPWLRSAFVDNAGIIAFDDHFDLAFKVETHNHPSALEPFGGANTGAGGVVRDVIGVSARPIANTDVLCFGPQDVPMAALPSGVLHPQRISDGVTAGIEDYGNRMGIPTVNFEYVYFARPDSVLEQQTIHRVRQRLGEALAAEAPAAAYIVVGVPDSATPAAIGYALASGIPYTEGLTKSRYIGRTFIQPDDRLRRSGIHLKYNPLRANLEGRRVVLVDDSIVRGNTALLRR